MRNPAESDAESGQYDGPGSPHAPRPPLTGTRPRGLDTDEVGDARLVELVRGGDDEAFATLVVRYERKLIRVLMRMVHHEELARDLAQETF